MKTITYLCIIFISIGFALAQTCGTKTCATGGECCDDVNSGYQCYDPNGYQCLSTSGGYKLCSNSDQACGNVCYDPSSYSCVDNEVVQGSNNYYPNVPCGNSYCTGGNDCCNDAVAGYQCYNPSSETCFANKKLCPNGEAACGNDCYDTADYHCVNGQLEQGPETCSSATNSSECTSRSPACGFCTAFYYEANPPTGTCYDTTKETCCGEYQDDCYNLLLCSRSAQSCCLPTFGCEYAGNPTCCEASESCCPGRHDTACCTSSQSCCANAYFSICCGEGYTCCMDPYEPQCCESGQTCTASGCVSSEESE